MNSTILQYVCVPCAAVFAVIWIFAALNEKGINPLDEIFQRFRKQPLLGMLLLPILIAKLIAFASVKMPTNDVPGSGSSPTNAPLMMMARGGGRGATRPPEYWLWRTGTNEVWSFDLMPEAYVVDSWRLRGAAVDWAVCATTNFGPVAMTTDGRLVTTNGVFTAYDGQLAIVPEVNWALLGTNAPSRAWWAETPWESTVFTWQNAFLGRDTNTPVSVQAEFTREGDFIYRYDLAAAGTNLTSELYYRLRPEDLTDDDRDGDGLLTIDEVSVYHSDPGLVDSDGDGLTDGAEVANGTDPTTRSVPNAEIVARIVGSPTNALYGSAWRPDPDVALTAIKLWDGFAADWPEGMTNLVYERTLNLGNLDGRPRYFLSSKADAAGDWDLRGLVLEWDDGRGNAGMVMASPRGDSFPLPVTNVTVTIRLKAIGPKVRSPKPMFLIGYAPSVTFSGGTPVYDEDALLRGYYFEAADGGRTLAVTIDSSRCPCKAVLSTNEMAESAFACLEEKSEGALAYAGDADGGVITIRRPVCFQLPVFKVDDPVTPAPRPLLKAPRGGSADDSDGKWIICLDPSVDYSGKHLFVTTGFRYDREKGDYCLEYYYPLDSECLWRSWQRTREGYWNCSCEPEVNAGGDADDLPFVEKICEVNSGRTMATGIIRIFGQEVWRGTAAHSWRDVGTGGGTSSGSQLLSKGDECDDCKGGCADGTCEDKSGGDLNSVEFRLSLGEPRQGTYSGFLHFESENPVQITPSLFALKARDDAAIEVETSDATTTYACSDNRGRDVVMAAIADGVRLTVNTHATGALDETWEIVNEGGDTNVVRITQISRLNNVLRDETYACDENGVWSKTDNVTGITEVLERADLLNDPTDGKLYETRTTYDADGNRLDCVYTETSRIGSFDNAVPRETYWERNTGSQVKWREATYWNDAAHKDRHGQLKLLTGNCCAWEYHDYDTRGFETLRVEQRNGSSVPTEFPEAVAGDLYWTSGLADAFVTVYDYTPFAGDDGHRDEADLARCETRYVVRNGLATCIARTWTRYTHVQYGRYAAVKAETWRAGSATARREDAANAYSYVITYSETQEGVPLVLRGEVAEELDADGVLTCCFVWEDWDAVIVETRKWFGGVEFPTYEVVERDSDFGNELRRATCLSGGDDVVDEEVSTYDEKNRLRSTTYADGTSLTNAFSCCRKLWSVDREGRKTLRSAVTGQDRLYYADEEVWLREVSTNGDYRVTQHFFDGLGREIETVTRVGDTPGTYTVPSASSPTGAGGVSVTTLYPDGGDDYVISVDARGRKTVRERTEFADRVESLVAVYSDDNASSPDLQTWTIQYRNGTSVTDKSWDGKWTRETETADYDADGCEVRYEVVASSDCGTVTNHIVHSDFLGRTVLEETPLGTTATAYRGATTRVESTTLSATGVMRVEEPVYNAWGESVGSVQDGVTNRTDESYEMGSDGNWWRVTRSVTASATEVASVTERREQLTGREAGVVSRRIDIDADGVTEETVERLGAREGERVTSVSNAVSGVTTQTRRYGIEQERTTPEETRQFGVNAFGRKIVEMLRGDGGRGPLVRTVEAISYNELGDAVACHTYTGATEFVTEMFGYDTYGRRVSSIDALHNLTTTRYDAVGNVIEQSGATWPVRYEYDTAGRRVSLSTTKDGRIWDVTRWSYDPQTGKCIAKRYPDGSQVTYAFAPDGLPLTTTKASGAWSRNAYDAKRQLVGCASSDGVGDAAFGYDDFGRMTAASNGVARYGYARHRGGVVTNEWVDLDGDVQIVRTVDGFGRLAGRGVSDQDLQAIAYDGQGRVATIASDVAVVAYAYGEGGVDAGYTLALNGGATVERHVVRDAYRPGQIVAVSNFVNGVAVGGETYTRDAKGRIVERVENVERVERIGYDAIGQVVEVANYQLPTTNYQLLSYSYDQIGNIAGSEALAYTTDGEVTELGGLSFGYDSASRLTTVTTSDVTIATYAYDAFDRRVRKTTAEATTTYLYDGWNLVREEIAGTNGTTDVIEYYWGKDISGSLDTAGGIGGLLYLKRNGAIYVPLYDASGNVTAYVDASGNVVVTFTYDAFGNCAVQSNNPNNRTIEQFSRFRYSTKYHDAETRLIYYGYRYYAPTAARWLTRDPLEEYGGLNLHAFCENDGVNKVDWLGQVPEPTADGDGRRFWRNEAKRLRRDGLERSAEMLEFSLEKRDSRHFTRGSELSKSIKQSAEYETAFKFLVAECPIGKCQISKDHNAYDLDYGGGDLYFAVTPTGLVEDRYTSARIKFSGSLCKTGNYLSDVRNVKLWIEVLSKYGYGEWRYDDGKGEEESDDDYQQRVKNYDKYKASIHAFRWTAQFKDFRE